MDEKKNLADIPSCIYTSNVSFDLQKSESLNNTESLKDDELPNDDDEKQFKTKTSRAYLFDCTHYSLAFSLLEGCVIAVLTLAPTSGSIGAISSGTLYLTFAITSLFSTYLVNIMSPKWAIVFGMFAYLLYIIAFAIGDVFDGLIIPCSAISGVGSACIWTGYGVYVTAIASKHAEIEEMPTGGSMGLFNGIFGSLFQICLFLGQLVSSLVLGYSQDDNTTILFVVFGVIAGASSIAMVFLRPNNDLIPKSTESPLTLILKTGHHFIFDHRIKLLSLSNVAFGFISGFQNGSFVSAFIVPIVGVENVGYVFALNFFVAGLWSFPIGYMSDRYGRAWGMILGYLSSMAFLIAAVVYPEVDSVLLLALYSILLGISQGTWNTLNAAIFSEYFEDSADSAFGNLKFWSGIATAIAFYAFPHMSVSAQLLLNIIFQTAGIIGFGLAHTITRRMEKERRARCDVGFGSFNSKSL